MKYRGQECEPRPFSDATGTGTEYLLDGKVVIREHATRILSLEEKAANEAAAAAIVAATEKTFEREAVYQLTVKEIPPATLAAKVAELKAAAAEPEAIK